MNVLFVTYDFPYPANSGGKNRAYNLLKIATKKHNVHLFSFVREDYNPDFNEEMYAINVKSIKVHKRKKVRSLSNIPQIVFGNSSIFKSLYDDKDVKDEILAFVKKEKIDIVHYESTYTGFLMNEDLKKHGVKQILGMENIEYQLYYDYAKTGGTILQRPFILHQAKRLKKEELSMVVKADGVTTITSSEASLMEVETGRKCFVVGNGIDPKLFPYSYDGKIKKNLLFVGNFTYFPNVDAINFFYGSVFSYLEKDITLTIIGKKCQEKLKFTDKRIILIDFVEDIISEYKKADALIFPIRIGGGTNFKVLEAMSLGIPIIANPDRLAGFNAKDNIHFLKALNASDYQTQISLLYEDDLLRKNLSKNSRELVESNFSWEKIGRDLLSVWEKVT